MSRKKAFLKNIRVSSVDLCRQGANPEAEILLAKSEDEKEENQKEEKKKNENKNENENKKENQPSVAEENGDFTPILEAIKQSIESIIEDSSAKEAQKIELLAQSITQFADELLHTAQQMVSEEGEKEENETENEEENKEENKEENQEEEKKVKKEVSELDIEQMSPKDKKAYESLLKKYKTKKKKESEDDSEIKKAVFEIHATKNELQQLKKQYELSYLEEISKKYESIGKDKHCLAQRLYQLKKNSVSAYDDYLAILDEQMEMTEKSGIFKEVGSSRPSGKSAVKRLQERAEELMKIDNSLTYIQAFIKACDENPQLREQYEEQ